MIPKKVTVDVQTPKKKKGRRKKGEPVSVSVCKKPYTYKQVRYNKEGWADSQRYLPGDGDLMYLKLADDKIIAGWIHGVVWYGLHLRKGDVVVAWKRKPEDKPCQ